MGRTLLPPRLWVFVGIAIAFPHVVSAQPASTAPQAEAPAAPAPAAAADGAAAPAQVPAAAVDSEAKQAEVVAQPATAATSASAAALQPSAAGEAAPSAMETQPSVSVSSGEAQSAAVEADTNVDAEEDASTKLPWRNSSLTFSQSLSMNTFTKTAQPSYDPNYAWLFILEPRWYLSKTIYLNADQRLNLELTDSNSTLYRRRVMLSDTVLGLDAQFYEHKLEGTGNTRLRAGVHAVAPTSLASRAASMVLGARVRVVGDLRLDHVLEGANISVQLRYLQRFLGHNTSQVDGGASGFPCAGPLGAVENCTSNDGNLNQQLSMGGIVTGSLQVSERFGVSALGWFTWNRNAEGTNVDLKSSTGQTISLPDRSNTHWHMDRYLFIAVNYDVTDWLNLDLSLINYFAERSDTGGLRAPGRSLDMMFAFSTSISLDSLYLAAMGQPTTKKVHE